MSSAPLLQTIEPDEVEDHRTLSGNISANAKPHTPVVLTPGTGASQPAGMATSQSDAEAGMSSGPAPRGRLTCAQGSLVYSDKYAPECWSPSAQRLTICRCTAVCASARPLLPLLVPNSCHNSIHTLRLLHEQLRAVGLSPTSGHHWVSMLTASLDSLRGSAASDGLLELQGMNNQPISSLQA